MFFFLFHSLTVLLVSGTTEKIFQDKTQLYDVYVDNQVITVTNSHLNDFLKVTKVDKQNYQNLLNLRLVVFLVCLP